MGQPVHVAYLVNQYPKVSHSFIRREIRALESRGFTVDRISIRGWDIDLVDPDDLAERAVTRFVLKDGLAPLLAASLRMTARRPLRFFSALVLAIRMSVQSERSLPYHLAYLAQACRVLEWLRDSGALHLHAHFSTNPAEVAMLVRKLGGPTYSFTSHGPEENDRGGFLGLPAKVRHAAFVAAVSSHTRSQVFRRADMRDWAKVKIVHCGLDEAFSKDADLPRPSEPRLICVGRLSPEKGQLILLDAMPQILKTHPACKLILAGDGELRQALEDRIAELELRDAVRITGWLTNAEVRREILASSVLVLPSFQEGLPVVLMEAMALKRPVISTYVAGIPELVCPGETGWLVAAGEVDGLAAAVDRVLTMPEADLRAIVSEAHLRVRDRHSIDVEAGKLAEYFRAYATADWSAQ
ncbi:MAG: glycosyltransferase [Hyphomicrobium sp.]